MRVDALPFVGEVGLVEPLRYGVEAFVDGLEMIGITSLRYSGKEQDGAKQQYSSKVNHGVYE
jgi:hypothetical protein